MQFSIFTAHSDFVPRSFYRGGGQTPTIRVYLDLLSVRGDLDVYEGNEEVSEDRIEDAVGTSSSCVFKF